MVCQIHLAHTNGLSNLFGTLQRSAKFIWHNLKYQRIRLIHYSFYIYILAD